jgi:hypothetical protein
MCNTVTFVCVYNNPAQLDDMLLRSLSQVTPPPIA